MLRALETLGAGRAAAATSRSGSTSIRRVAARASRRGARGRPLRGRRPRLLRARARRLSRAHAERAASGSSASTPRRQGRRARQVDAAVARVEARRDARARPDAHAVSDRRGRCAAVARRAAAARRSRTQQRARAAGPRARAASASSSSRSRSPQGVAVREPTAMPLGDRPCGTLRRAAVWSRRGRIPTCSSSCPRRCANRSAGTRAARARRAARAAGKTKPSKEIRVEAVRAAIAFATTTSARGRGKVRRRCIRPSG